MPQTPISGVKRRIDQAEGLGPYAYSPGPFKKSKPDAIIPILYTTSPIAYLFGDEPHLYPHFNDPPNTLQVRPVQSSEFVTWVPQFDLVSGLPKLLEETKEMLLYDEDDREGFDKKWLKDFLNLPCTDGLAILIDKLTTFADHQSIQIEEVSNTQRSSSLFIPLTKIAEAFLTSSTPRVEKRLASAKHYALPLFTGTPDKKPVHKFEQLMVMKNGRLGIYYKRDLYMTRHLPEMASVCQDGRSILFFSVARPAAAYHCVDGPKWVPLGRATTAEGDELLFSPLSLDSPCLSARNGDSCMNNVLSYAFLDWNLMDILLPLPNGNHLLLHTKFISRGTLSALLILLKNHIFSLRGLSWTVSVFKDLFWNVFLRVPGIFLNSPNRSAEDTWCQAVAAVMTDTTLKYIQTDVGGWTNWAIKNYKTSIQSTHPSMPALTDQPWDRCRLKENASREEIISSCLNPSGYGFMSSLPSRDHLRMPLWVNACKDTEWSAKYLEICQNKEVGRTVVARAPLPEGAPVAEYIGELVTHPLSMKIREGAYDSLSAISNASYVFYFTRHNEVFFDEKEKRPVSRAEEEQRLMLDASVDSIGFGRLFNHSRKAYNTVPKIVTTCDCNHPRMCFVTNKDLVAGEELRIDYGETSSHAKVSNPWLNN